MDTINPEDVAKKYNSLEIIWDENDKWHSYTKTRISDFISSFAKQTKEIDKFQILNAGSGGNSYSLSEKNILHMDIAESKISQLHNSLVADIHSIPVPDSSFDLVICVGSVINYCDPVVVLKELARLCKKEGFVILEFENSHTLELIGKSTFNRKAVLIKTFYNGQSEKLWFFSENYILELSKLNGFKPLRISRFHILSPLIYRITKSEKIAARFATWDSFCSRIPFLHTYSSNTIFLLTRNSIC